WAAPTHTSPARGFRRRRGRRRVDVLDPARHHLFLALVTPTDRRRRIGIGAVVRTVVVVRSSNQYAALLDVNWILEAIDQLPLEAVVRYQQQDLTAAVGAY